MKYKYKLITYVLVLNILILAAGIYFLRENRIALFAVEGAVILFSSWGINLFRQF